MGLSQNPKIILLSHKIFQRSKLIGLVASFVGFIYFCVFNHLHKKVDVDSRMFSHYPGNSVLTEQDEEFLNKTSQYFVNYDYDPKVSMIDVVFEYIQKNLSPLIETEKYPVKVDDNLKDSILISNVPCKFCSNTEKLVVGVNFDYSERKQFHSISVALTLMKHLSECDYMSKDTIFVFANKEWLYGIGFETFINLYLYGNFTKRRPIIRSATIIEIDSIYPSYVKINYESLNGLLANQDMVLLFMNELKKNNIPIKIDPIFTSMFNMALERTYDKGHFHFLRESIPSYTVTGSSRIPLKNKMFSLFEFTKSFQSFLRSQSNTHEAYVHSSSFYFFDTPDYQIPISIYCFSIYFLCAYCVFKLFKSRLLRNYINFFIGMICYIITTVIIALPVYLFSTNSKLYGYLQRPQQLPMCREWHPDHFEKYKDLSFFWIRILLCSLFVGFVFNLLIYYLIKRIHRKRTYEPVKKLERVILLFEIKNAQKKKKLIYEKFMENNEKENNSNEHDGEIYKNTRSRKKPKVIDSDDESIQKEKKAHMAINKLDEYIMTLKEKMSILENTNVKYIYTNSIASYLSIMKHMTILSFILSSIVSSLYNWSYSALFCLTFVVPISLLHKLNNRSKRITSKIILFTFISFVLLYIYPFDNFILNERRKLTYFLMILFNRCENVLKSINLSYIPFFPSEILSFICSNKVFDTSHMKKYFLNGKSGSFFYEDEMKNSVLMHFYNLVRNHYCIGTMTYPFTCFIIFPMFFYIIFIYFLP